MSHNLACEYEAQTRSPEAVFRKIARPLDEGNLGQ
jgi:hypothetical protein